jgi:hypothetical protein
MVPRYRLTAIQLPRHNIPPRRRSLPHRLPASPARRLPFVVASHVSSVCRRLHHHHLVTYPIAIVLKLELGVATVDVSYTVFNYLRRR